MDGIDEMDGVDAHQWREHRRDVVERELMVARASEFEGKSLRELKADPSSDRAWDSACRRACQGAGYANAL